MASLNTGGQGGVCLAIVGTRALACRGDRDRAKARVVAAIKRLSPDTVITGGADGSDKIGEEVATELGYSEDAGTLVVFRPRAQRLHGPGGFRERDEQIAQACTHLLRIFCRQDITDESGWTADHAEGLGAVVVRYDVCIDRNQPSASPPRRQQVRESVTPVPARPSRPLGPVRSTARRAARIYVDDWRQRACVGGVKAVWSHMVADPWIDPEELHRLARSIGMHPSWYQVKPWPKGHYDVTESRRRLAIARGAIPITWREMGEMLATARRRGRDNPPPAESAGEDDEFALFPINRARRGESPGGG
jgi:hypothetical protein